MGLLGRKMPERNEAECLGEECPYFTGEQCESYEEWVSASATKTRGRDTSKPPLRDETKYIIYGQACTAGSDRKMVAQRIDIHMPDQVSGMELIARSGRYGDMPVFIQTVGNAATAEARADSD